MKFSQLFTKTLRESPKDEISVNAQYLHRAGYIRKAMAGVYAYMPLGWKTIQKITQIIRDEINAIGGQELQFTSLQPKELWEKTSRWELLGSKEKIMHQFEDHSQKKIGLASTHEEPATFFAKDFIDSYKDLPKAIYQFQKKFRDELRPKSGLVRLREFLMKDLYSFHVNEEDLGDYYQKVADAYFKIFERCGLQAVKIEASGGIFTKNVSHEFQVLSPYGEDKILYCSKCQWAQNKEVANLNEGDKCPNCGSDLGWATGVEVGNIFNNGTKYSKDLDLYYKDKSGQKQLVFMASYGIGLDRLMGTIVDIHHDEKGIIWPESVSPFSVHLIGLAGAEREAEKMYKELVQSQIDVLFDDREDVSAGEKFADADLMGMPIRVVVSPKLVEKNMIEVKKRSGSEAQEMQFEKFVKSHSN